MSLALYSLLKDIYLNYIKPRCSINEQETPNYKELR